jgi:hypothetical protein
MSEGNKSRGKELKKVTQPYKWKSYSHYNSLSKADLIEVFKNHFPGDYPDILTMPLEGNTKKQLLDVLLSKNIIKRNVARKKTKDGLSQDETSPSAKNKKRKECSDDDDDRKPAAKITKKNGNDDEMTLSPVLDGDKTGSEEENNNSENDNEEEDDEKSIHTYIYSEIGEDPPVPLKDTEVLEVSIIEIKKSGILDRDGMYRTYRPSNPLMGDKFKLKQFLTAVKKEGALIPVYGAHKIAPEYCVMDIEEEVEEIKTGNAFLDIDMINYPMIRRMLQGTEVDMLFGYDRYVWKRMKSVF